MSESTEPHWRDLADVDADESQQPVPDPHGSGPGDGPDEAALEAFWNEASVRARFDSIGRTAVRLYQPLRLPAGPMADTGPADAFVADLLDLSTETTAAAPKSDYEAEGVTVPEVGAVSIVLDGANQPRVLVATTAVTDDGTNIVEHLRVLYPTKHHR